MPVSDRRCNLSFFFRPPIQGLQDAHNLCWKLAAVHSREAGRGLLRSYDAERRPVANANARLSVHNYHRGLRVAEALGLPTALPHVAGAAAATFEPMLSSLLPAAWRDALPPSTAALRVGRELLIGQLGHEASHPLGQSRRRHAAEVVAWHPYTASYLAKICRPQTI
jgi:2,4-dichlorophenol 6-monooxygenase